MTSTMILYEDMNPVEHLPLQPTCVLSPWCAHALTVI